MDLNEVRVFVKVVQAGSFNQAAKRLGIPNSTASAKVSALEERLGVTLLQRTTRRLNLTEAGQAYFHRCVKALDEIADAEAELGSARQEVKGRLRVTAPIDLGSTCLTGLILSYGRKYPRVSLELLLSDELKDLVADGIDVAIRAGQLGDSGLLARKVGVAKWAPYASPAFLKKHGKPVHPKELGKYACLQFSPLDGQSWELSNGKTTITAPVAAGVGANDLNLIKALAVAGSGIALLPSFACHIEVRQGKLVRVLPEWSAFTEPVHLVYPEQKFVPHKVRTFVDEAAEAFRDILKA